MAKIDIPVEIYMPKVTKDFGEGPGVIYTFAIEVEESHGSESMWVKAVLDAAYTEMDRVIKMKIFWPENHDDCT